MRSFSTTYLIKKAVKTNDNTFSTFEATLLRSSLGLSRSLFLFVLWRACAQLWSTIAILDGGYCSSHDFVNVAILVELYSYLSQCTVSLRSRQWLLPYASFSWSENVDKVTFGVKCSKEEWKRTNCSGDGSW